jgi:hypothetical protein
MAEGGRNERIHGNRIEGAEKAGHPALRRKRLHKILDKTLATENTVLFGARHYFA